jgi:hypothetical protein
MQEVIDRYGVVGYIAVKNCEIRIVDGYKSKYSYQREWPKDLIHINDEGIRKLLIILLSNSPTFKTKKICLGSYLIEVDL